MGFLSVVHSDRGIKKNTNQDSVLIKEASTDYGDVMLAVVCDGMGGLAKGEVASAALIKAFSMWFEVQFPELLYRRRTADGINRMELENEINKLILDVNQRIADHGKISHIAMGTTAAVTVQTYCEGKETYKEEYPVENENADDKKSGYTLEQIKKMAHKTISEKVKASNNNSNTDGTQPAISGWTHSANAGVSDDATHTCQVTFAADGDYTFTLETTDLAGNASSYNRVDDFTIDRTVPTIQVSYDNNSAATPGYFNANRTATVTVNEHNFNAAEVNAQITAALQGSGVAAPGLGGWSTNGDVHTASVTFSADADYTFDVDYTDLAGNAAADYTQDKFTVDKTDPEVEFFDIEDKSANNGTVAPGVKYSDVNYMESGVDITIKGAKHDKTELSGNRTNIANGESIKMEDFKHDEETDDVYTMTAVIKDKAGNETEKEVMFSVNRFGSNYIFSETTEKFLDDVYANKPKDIVVTEVNVDSLVFNGISYGLDGTKKELKPGSDYTVKQSGGEGSWKEYTYTIKKENFEKEGRYSVTIDSEDKATNKMNNKVKECNIDFVIDKTPPTVVITGIEESSYRADEREMTINLSDNTAVKSVDVIIDGRSVATYAQKEIEKAGGKISYMIEGASEPQKIEAAALDMAGNETTSEMHKVLVTSSVWIQYINNTPLLIGSILGIVLVAGGLIWFFVIRKKKEESK